MEFAKQREYVGDLAQLFELREARLCGGRAEGVRAVLLSDGAGMELMLLPDRCLDLYSLKYRGKNLGYLTPAGVAGPAFYDRHGDNWLKSYGAGFLATCGLSNIGSPCEDAGEALGLHGELANTPAERLCVCLEEEDGLPVARVSALMRSAALFGGNLTLTRTVTVGYRSGRVELTDVIRNEGFETRPYMALYHFNMGYPLLSEQARLSIPTRRVTPRSPHAAAHAREYLDVTPPRAPYEEMCYYHDLEADAEGFSTVGIENPAEGLAASIRFDRRMLDHFVQWKMLGKGDYAMGLEPCNATIDGRADARANGSLKFLEPGAQAVHRLTVKVGERL